ncbi:MAG: hypothetical protein GEU95_01125 [Rhizobiales bacterium]|nr:hypothetical protein [Hyphomicrobiales bacterium]
MGRTKGRPPSRAPRTASGRPIAKANGAYVLFHRLRKAALAIGTDPRILTELTLLGLRGELTDRQVSAGLKVAEIYRTFERWHGKRRATASPDFERTYGRGGERGDDSDGRVLKAEEDWKNLQDIIDADISERQGRELIESVCVEDRRPLDQELDALRSYLDVIAREIVRDKRDRKRKRVQLPSIAVTAKAPPRPAPKRADLDKAAWIACARQMRPDISLEQAEAAWRDYLDRRAFEFAKADRGAFRRDKERKRA